MKNNNGHKILESKMRYLMRLAKKTNISLDNFYTISIQNDIRLQGYFEGKLIKELHKLGLKSTVSDNGWVEIIYKSIFITLT